MKRIADLFCYIYPLLLQRMLENFLTDDEVTRSGIVFYFIIKEEFWKFNMSPTKMFLKKKLERERKILKIRYWNLRDTFWRKMTRKIEQSLCVLICRVCANVWQRRLIRPHALLRGRNGKKWLAMFAPIGREKEIRQNKKTPMRLEKLYFSQAHP